MLVSLTLLLISVGLINYTIDPAGIYHNSIESNDWLYNYANKLVTSKYGLLKPPQNCWKERDIKRALARQGNDVDCAIIGSSHIMEISSYRDNRSLKNLCPSLMNLGVSGATLEDYLALSYELVQNGKTPKIIVFGVDPWSFDFKNDARWQAFKNSYENMIEYLEKSYIRVLIDDIYIKSKLFINLINLEYFLQSKEAMSAPKISSTKNRIPYSSIREAPFFDISKGSDGGAVTLPDGSHAYAKEYIQKTTPPKVSIGGGTYKIKQGSQISESAITVFCKLVKRLNRFGITTVLLMTPYHHNVWADKSSITTKALIEVEARIRKLGKDLDLKILGSYNPQNIGCNPDEFFDYMHARDSCLSKIAN